MPETDVVPCTKVNVDAVIVEASIVLLKLTAITWFKATSIAAFAGIWRTYCGWSDDDRCRLGDGIGN